MTFHFRKKCNWEGGGDARCRNRNLVCLFPACHPAWFRLQIGRGRQYSGEHPGDQYQRSSPPPPTTDTDRAEIEFVDISLTKGSSLLLHAIHSPFYWRILHQFNQRLESLAPCYWHSPFYWRILHQFNQWLESLAPCYSQSFLLADFKENYNTLLWF